MQRRHFITLLSGLPLASLGRSLQAQSTIDCHFTPVYHEGPFYIKQSPLRRDITEGLAGYPMMVRMTLLASETCQPMANIPVDIWQAAPDGNYSGVNNGLLVRGQPNNEGSSFLRGTQVTDAAGRVEFKSLFPGWYPITPPHIHFSCRVTATHSFTSQFFIEDSFAKGIYTRAPAYRERGEHPVKLGWRSDTPLMVVPAVTDQGLVLEKIIGIATRALRPTCGYYQRGC